MIRLFNKSMELHQEMYRTPLYAAHLHSGAAAIISVDNNYYIYDHKSYGYKWMNIVTRQKWCNDVDDFHCSLVLRNPMTLQSGDKHLSRCIVRTNRSICHGALYEQTAACVTCIIWKYFQIIISLQRLVILFLYLHVESWTLTSLYYFGNVVICVVFT